MAQQHPLHDIILDLYRKCDAAAGRVEECEDDQYKAFLANDPNYPYEITTYALLKCNLSNLDSVFTLEAWPSTSPKYGVPRKGPILVGFYLQTEYTGPPVSISVDFSDTYHLPPVTLVPGEIRFAMEDRFMIPLIALRFVSVCLHLSDPAVAPFCRLVYGDLRLKDLRLGIHWTGHLRSGEQFIFTGGMFGTTSSSSDEPSPSHPNEEMRVLPPAPERSWRIPAARKQQWLATIERELVQSALHPKYMGAFLEVESGGGGGNDNDDPVVGIVAPRIMRLGEVCLIDGALKETETARLAELADGVVYLGLHPCPEVLALLQGALRRARMPGTTVVVGKEGGDAGMVTLGRSRARETHRDQTLVGGSLSVLAFLDTPEGSGGEVTFYPEGDQEEKGTTIVVAPRRGRIVVFDVLLPHSVAAPQGVKRIAGCEAVVAGGVLASRKRARPTEKQE